MQNTLRRCHEQTAARTGLVLCAEGRTDLMLELETRCTEKGTNDYD
jgi:hypothetical protein